MSDVETTDNNSSKSLPSSFDLLGDTSHLSDSPDDEEERR